MKNKFLSKNKLKTFIEKRKFQKETRKQKKKLFVQDAPTSRYTSKRNKFRLFSSKLKFDNSQPFKQKKNIYYFLIGGFLLISSVYVLFFSHYFSIKSIDVIREDDVINIDIAYKSIERYRFKSIFLTNKFDIQRSLISHQPNIFDVSIRKVLPDNLKIIIKSYPELFQSTINDKNYFITQNGVMIPGKNNEQIQHISLVGIEGVGILDYRTIFDQQYIQDIQFIFEQIKQSNSFVTITDISYYLKEREVHLFDQSETRFIFDLDENIEAQIEKLNIFYKNYTPEVQSGIVYIDLRIDEKIIYCSKRQEAQCIKNIQSIYE